MPAAPFVWYELMTKDLDGALAFYGEVLGWKAADAGMPGMRYVLLKVGETPVGGSMDLNTPGCPEGASTGWTGYVGVDDVDAYAERAGKAGGAVHMAPQDIPNVGRFAMVADPQGAVFALFKGSSEAPPAIDETVQGAPCWRELHSSDAVSGWDFYRELFGWREKQAMDMGPMGVYRIFGGGGEDMTGGMFTDPEAARPYWLYYFNVDDIDAAAERVTAAGGQVTYGPAEVPGGYIVNALDPQGGAFGLSGPRK